MQSTSSRLFTGYYAFTVAYHFELKHKNHPPATEGPSPKIRSMYSLHIISAHDCLRTGCCTRYGSCLTARSVAWTCYDSSRRRIVKPLGNQNEAAIRAAHHTRPPLAPTIASTYTPSVALHATQPRTVLPMGDRFCVLGTHAVYEKMDSQKKATLTVTTPSYWRSGPSVLRLQLALLVGIATATRI